MHNLNQRERLHPQRLAVDGASGVQGVQAGVHEDQHERERHDADDRADRRGGAPTVVGSAIISSTNRLEDDSGHCDEGKSWMPDKDSNLD